MHLEHILRIKHLLKQNSFWGSITWNDQKKATPYPWPIFSNFVYFRLGSPTLTMVPEKKKKKKTLCHILAMTQDNSRCLQWQHKGVIIVNED